MRFSTSTRLITPLLTMLLALAVPAIATADGDDVIRDCAQDGDLDRDYSDQELDDAYRNMPSDVDEYSNCRDTIRQAQAGGRGSEDGLSDEEEARAGGGGTASEDGSGGGYRDSTSDDDVTGTGGTASDNEALERREEAARGGGGAPGGADDSDNASSTTGGDSSLPAIAIAAIVLLILAALVGGVYALRDRLPPGLASRLPGSGPGQGR